MEEAKLLPQLDEVSFSISQINNEHHYLELQGRSKAQFSGPSEGFSSVSQSGNLCGNGDTYWWGPSERDYG